MKYKQLDLEMSCFAYDLAERETWGKVPRGLGVSSRNFSDCEVTDYRRFDHRLRMRWQQHDLAVVSW